LTFFVDVCLSPNFAGSLRLFGEDIIYLTDLYRPDTKDRVWIPRVCKDGFIVLTADKAQIKVRGKTHVECALYQRHKGRAFFFPNGFSEWRIMRQIPCFFRAWPNIANEAENMPKGSFFDALENGNIKPKHIRKVN
jgi:hypothetical protein